MAVSLFKKANREQAKLKMLIDGPSGSGKTQTMLLVLKGLCGPEGKIAVLDSENHSVVKKPDKLLENIDVANIEERNIETYIRHIENAEELGYDGLGIDSLTHPWQELMEDIERIAKARYKGNFWSAWKEGTPIQRKFINTILFSKLHIVATGRVKTHWETEKNERGKVVPVKIGLDTEQGKGLEYEFDIWGRMTETNSMEVTKDRFDVGLQGKIFEKPNEDFGVRLREILSTGDPYEIEISKYFNILELSPKQKQQAREKYPDKKELVDKLKEQTDKPKDAKDEQ